eukprot:TRINITY_DN16510_c0_g1_i1.p1 TRINITY_DN16510_c0_g1~~TRINITY_DN16510_c0_g1_i1.p1  ORF type:complete len:738 (-),score=94.97 TRINITY_DN16510_c0_g1_i1:13-2226(-)
MKFAKQLEEYECPEWKGHYLPYKELKHRLESLTETPGSLDATPVATPRASQERTGWQNSPNSLLKQSAGPASDIAKRTLTEDWLRSVETEALRVGDFTARGAQGLEQQLKDLAKMAENLRIGRSSLEESGTNEDEKCGTIEEEAAEEAGDESSLMELRVLQAVGRVSEGVQRLRAFAELNHAALYKILKKHDKQVGSKHGLSELFPRLVRVTGIADRSRLDALDSDLKKLSLQSLGTDTIDASPEVARLIAGLGRSGMAVGGVTLSADSSSHRMELILSFFLGTTSALFLAIGVLLALPEKQPRTYSEAYFLTPIPVFRVVFSLLLILWCTGAVARICDRSDINHMFILNVDPRCRITPEFFFSRAATLTTCWILIFGMYVVDYKWQVLPTVWAKTGFNKRASLHFLLYPVSLLLITFVGLIWPSSVFRNRYKLALAQSAKRTAMAPRYPVDFADNMVGDILTSLAKPMQDVPAATCYLLSHHPQEETLVTRFMQYGDTCSDMTHAVVLPIIAGLPFLFRALQCTRRFQDSKFTEMRHLWNLGKYLCSLLVVIVSRTNSTTALVIISTIATIYAFTWDVALDWGLSYKDFLRSRGSEKREEGQDSAGSPSKGHGPERHFPKRVYWFCSFLDLVFRSTWVFTLMPSRVLGQNIVARVVLVSVMSSVEIVRRSVWAVLRIEYEQISNASGFRALLWVPSKLNAGGTSGQHNEKGVERQSSIRHTISDKRQPLLSQQATP